MRFQSILVAVVSATVALGVPTANALESHVQLGPRPFHLVDKLPDGKLKNELRHCAARTHQYKQSPFSIGHRGAAMQFPEHTKESYLAAARMGAGIIGLFSDWPATTTFYANCKRTNSGRGWGYGKKRW